MRNNHKIISKDDYPQKVNSFHEYGIKKLGRNFRIIAIAQDGVIEAIVQKHKPDGCSTEEKNLIKNL